MDSQIKSLSDLSNQSNKNIDVESDDISMSELELLANKKKLNKQSDVVSDNINDESETHNKSIKSSIKSKKSILKPQTKNTTISTDSTYEKRYKHKKVQKENKNNDIRQEKSNLLFKLYTIIEKSNGKWSTKMTMDNSLDEIKNEFTRIKSILDNESMVKFCKHGLIMGIKGMEMLNNAYDPIGVDLDGWSEAMSYNMATTEYDEVLSELCEKYKGTGSMSPEIKLLLMIVMSGAMFSFSKKAVKDPNTLTDLMSAFMSKPAQQPPQQPPQQSPQKSSSSRRSSPPQYSSQMPQPFDQMNIGNITPQNIPSINELYQQRNDLNSEDSDDIPSKIRGPTFNSPDSINIERIIQTMKANNKQKENMVKMRPDIEQILNETELTDIKNIPTPTKRRGKGRPKKNQKTN